MAQRIKSGSRRSSVIKLARDVSRGCGKDKLCRAKALYKFVRDEVEFSNDPVGLEMVTSPALTFGLDEYENTGGIWSGDCDCKVTALGSLLYSIGIPVRIVIVNAPPLGKKQYAHVYLEGVINGMPVSMDANDPKYKFGWSYKGWTKQGILDVSTGKFWEMNNNPITSVDRDLDYDLFGLNQLNQLSPKVSFFDNIANYLRTAASAVERRQDIKTAFLTMEAMKFWIRNPLTWVTLAGVGILSIRVVQLRRKK